MRLGRCSPAERLPRPAVEGNRHGCKVVGAVHAEVGAVSEFVPIVSESYEIEISGAMLRANVGIDLSFDGEIVSLLYGSALVIDPA